MYAIKINSKYYWCTVPRPFSLDIRRAVIYKTVKRAEAQVRDLSGRLHYICDTRYNHNSIPDDLKGKMQFTISIVEVEMREIKEVICPQISN